MSPAPLLSAMWADYCALNSQAAHVHDLLAAKGAVRHDHIVLRTLNHSRLGAEQLARVFLENGYARQEDYLFADQRMTAMHLEPREAVNPKILICELKLEECSAALRAIMEELVEQIDEATLDRDDLSVAGRPWDLTSQEYDALMAESEFAAWFAAYGFRPNQFAVLVNDAGFADLGELNAWLKSNGVALDTTGGEITGGPHDYLAQSSTIAEDAGVHFSDGLRAIPACAYAFVQRFPLKSGEIFQGFAATPADRIIELASARR